MSYFWQTKLLSIITKLRQMKENEYNKPIWNSLFGTWVKVMALRICFILFSVKKILRTCKCIFFAKFFAISEQFLIYYVSHIKKFYIPLILKTIFSTSISFHSIYDKVFALVWQPSNWVFLYHLNRWSSQ